MGVASNDPQTWIGLLIAVLLGLIVWNAKRLIRKQDEHDRRIARLESRVATKEDIDVLHDCISDMKETMNAQHVQILERILRLSRVDPR